MRSILKTLLVAGAALALPAALSAADAQEAWNKDCKKCHGADGAAQTPMGKKLKLKNYTDPAVQAAMTDEEIITAMKNGVKDESTGKMKMPAYEYDEELLQAMLALIRSMDDQASP